MFIYAIATVPLIREVENKPCWTQLWYADDSSAIGEITNLHSWLVKLLEIGPRYGYFPEPNKSSLIVKESMLSYARSCFHDLGVNVVTNCRFLGGVIGDTPGKHSFVSRQVGEWSHYIDVLSSVAVNQPQSAYIALTRSLQHEWSFLQRVTSDCGQLFEDIETMLASRFIPALFGQDSTSQERLLYSLPARMGGLDIVNPVSSADHTYSTSRKATHLLIEAIKGICTFSVSDHDALVSDARLDHTKSQQEINDHTFSYLLNQSDPFHQRSLLRNRESLSACI